MEQVAIALRDLMVMMHNAFPSCETDEGQCKFPFKYQDDLYDRCTNASKDGIQDGAAWCFAGLDKNGGSTCACPQLRLVF